MVDHILEIPEPNVKNVIPHNYVYKQRRYLCLYVYYVYIYLNSTFFRPNFHILDQFIHFSDWILHVLDQIF